MAPICSASSHEVSVVSTPTSVSTASLAAEDLVELGAGRLAVVREVEAQVVGRDQRALLAHVVTQHRPQRHVQQVVAV